MAREANLRGGTLESGASATATAPRSPHSQVEESVARATNWLLSQQTQEGYWWAELEADTTLESDYILYLHILGQLNSPKVPKLAKYIRDHQLADGGWNIFHGGPAELNATVKAYVGFAAGRGSRRISAPRKG